MGVWATMGDTAGATLGGRGRLHLGAGGGGGEEEVGSRRGRRERGAQQMWAAPIAVQDIVISCFLFPQILAKWARSPTRAEQREEEAVGAESQLRLGPLSF